MADFLDIFNCCDICGSDHPTEQCPELGDIPSEAQLGGYVTKARLTLPSSLKVTDSRISSIGVIATELIPERTQLGPFEAKRTTHVFDDTGFFTLKLVAKDGTTVCLDTTDENECNWMCLVRPALSEETRNCMAYQLGTNIYYNTTENIYPGKELQVWYTTTYARKLGKPTMPDGISKALLGHRIEPIQSDLVIEPLVDGPPESAQHPEQDQQRAEGVEYDTELRGEIKKGFYCPRCGNSFESQSAMVQHLREHVITGSNVLPVSNKKGRGRPRIHPIVTDSSEPVFKRPRGRPRKEKPSDYNPDIEYTSPDKTDDFVDDESVESEDYDECIDGDRELNAPMAKRIKIEYDLDDSVDYSPVNDVKGSGRRVLSRRSGKGTNKFLMKDYVVGKVKREEQDETKEVVKNNTNAYTGIQKTDKRNIEMNVVSDVKRKRGRPRKVKQLITGNVDENGFVHVDLINENVEDFVEAIDKESNLAEIQLEGNVSEEKCKAIPETQSESQNKELDESPDVGMKVKANEEDTMDDPEEGDDGHSSHPDNDAVEEKDLNQENAECEEEFDKVGNDTPEDECENDEITQEDPTIYIDNGEEEAAIDEENTDPQITNSDAELVIHFDEETKIYTCSKCSEEFDQQVDAIDHAMTHNKLETSFNCFMCKQTFDNDTELREHIASCSIKNKASECEQDENQNEQDENQNDQGEPNDTNEGPHVCDICQQEFKTPQYLYRHMVMHTDMFSCTACLKTFSRKDSLYKHVLRCCPDDAERLKIMHCDLCLRVFSTASGRDKHKAKCTLVKCLECGGRFSNKDDLDVHKCKDGKSEDPSAGRYNCGKCPKAFQSLHYLKQHALLHKKLHACSKCGKSLPSEEELENHSIICQTIEAIKLLGQGRCEKCGELFISVKLFREHAMSHTHPYQCSHCFRRFIRVGTLSSHDCQNQADNLTCKICSKSFKNADSLYRHVEEHGCLRYQCSACGNQFHMKSEAREHECAVKDGEEERKILYTSDSREVCAVCGKSFATRSNLLKHMVLHGDKNFPCPQCDKRFHLDSYLKEHITCVHYKIYKFQCPHCGKLLKSRTGLNMHILLFHSDSTETFNCTECPRVFKAKGNLKAHMYRHSTDRKFKCNVCSRTFKFPDQLSRHKVEHKIVEKLSCIYCEKQFCRRYELNKHLQIYHSGYVYVCGVCSAKCGHRHTLVRHYKRKHPDDYHVLSQEGYLQGLLRHVSELPGYKPPEAAEPTEGVDQIPDEGLKFLPEDAVKALHSLSLGTCTMKEYQILKERGLIKTDENAEEPAFAANDRTVLEDLDGNVLQAPAIMHQEQLVSSEETIPATVMNEQIGLIQTSDGTININSIQGLPQTLETLEGTDGQIVILQIVESSEQIVSDIGQGEIIQQLQVGAGEPINIQQDGITADAEQEVQTIQALDQTVVSDEVQIVNFNGSMGVNSDGAKVTQMEGGLLHIQNLTEEQMQQMTLNGQTVETIQIVEGGVVENETETV